MNNLLPVFAFSTFRWLSIIFGTLVTTSHLLILTCSGKVISFSSFSSLFNGIICFLFHAYLAHLATIDVIISPYMVALLFHLTAYVPVDIDLDITAYLAASIAWLLWSTGMFNDAPVLSVCHT